MTIFFFIAGVVCSVVGLLCLLFMLACYRTTAGFVSSTATSSSGDGEPGERLTVRFKADFGDREFQPFFEFSTGRYKPGDHIKVRYNPHIVWCCQAGVFGSRWAGVLFFLFCGVTFLWASTR
ncbi:MAG: DUF3592 domain-containing protein [Planctomycetota bacterium]